MKKLDESLIADIPPFRRLSPREIREVLELASSKRHAAGSFVFNEGEEAGRFYLLLDGHIRVVRSTESGEQVISIHIPPGQLFGIAKALGRSTYPASALCADECLTASWPMSLWDSFNSRYDGFTTETYKVVGDRVRQMNDTIMEMATKQVEQRVACAVLRLIQQGGRKTRDGIEVAFPITRQDISEMTGTTLHTVSRLLSAWEKDGVVVSKRRHVLVSDPHALVLLSGQ